MFLATSPARVVRRLSAATALLVLASSTLAQAQAAPAPATPAALPPPAATSANQPVSVTTAVPAAPAPEPAAVEPTAPSAPPAAVEPAGPSIVPAGPTLEAAAAPAAAPEPPKDTPWYEKLKIRGYTQIRYNRLPTFNDNDNLVNAQGDRYIGKGNGFGIRRARVILFGDVHEHLAVYLQTDFASVIGEQYHVPTVRDWYADIFIDKAKEFRFRVGQSKVPFGFENMQSSQNRLPLDRSDSLNSAVRDERDLGVFFYWAPAEIRKRFKHLVDSGLKGSGDYGAFALGAFNGQNANRPALADHMHGVVRMTWPFLIGEQFLEVGGGGYYGKYRVAREAEDDDQQYIDRKDARGHATFVLYPQPFGFVMEGNYGIGPEWDKRGSTDELAIVDEKKIYGGYAQVMYKFDKVIHTDAIIPFARGTYYRGGKKFETNAPAYLVKELEIGVEWQFFKNLEMVLAYDMADRTSSKTYKREKGHVTRVQLQFNY